MALTVERSGRAWSCDVLRSARQPPGHRADRTRRQRLARTRPSASRVRGAQPASVEKRPGSSDTSRAGRHRSPAPPRGCDLRSTQLPVDDHVFQVEGQLFLHGEGNRLGQLPALTEREAESRREEKRSPGSAATTCSVERLVQLDESGCTRSGERDLVTSVAGQAVELRPLPGRAGSAGIPRPSGYGIPRSRPSTFFITGIGGPPSPDAPG